MARNQGMKTQYRIVLYADDLKFQCDSSASLQLLLNVASKSASEEGMKWNIKKCHVLEL